ncbi:unnamed protein product [Calicophoron daubneyi]|uniref:Serine/threonine-protein phosphatase 2A 55 kDa regulatory subunit B n=1 Tax=Calicophoron daubneyi TaxID=300641 RepID=A0AAV2TAH9_CALDB
MHRAPKGSLDWLITQVQGPLSNDTVEGDSFTCIEYNGKGDLLAAGDKSGHITVFKPSESRSGRFEIYCAFTSHEPEFDYLKSLEIEEKINSITWLPCITSAHHLLSANDKTIKLWRISERQREAYNFNLRDDEGSCLWGISGAADPDTPGPPIPQLRSPSELRVPRFRRSSQLTVEARPRRVYANAHTYHINAVSLNSDQETFLSADDLRINLWHLDISDQSFTIVDLKPPNMEDLSEVITCARFHPSQCHMFAYSTSRGVIRLCDMRLRALCDSHVLVLEDPQVSQNLEFFADIIASLSDFRFGHCGNYVLARDYLTLKVWDVRMGDRPCELYAVHEPFRSQLCMLYENDAIFDKFLCSWSGDDRYILTGSYGNLFRIFDRTTGSDNLYDLNDSSPLLSNPTATSAELSRKTFISPQDPLGICLGLTTVCAASADAVEDLLSDSGSSNSPTSSSDATVEDELDATNDVRLEAKRNRAYDSSSVGNSSSNGFPDISRSSGLPTGSKRRKQLFPLRTDGLDGSNSSHSHRHHHKKHRHKKAELVSNPSSDDLLSLSNEFEEDEGGGGDVFTITTEKPCAKDHQLGNERTPGVVPPLRLKLKSKKRELLIDHFASGQLSLSNAHHLDCQRKVLQLAWHPHSLTGALLSGNQIFFVSSGGDASVTSPAENGKTPCKIDSSPKSNDQNSILSTIIVGSSGQCSDDDGESDSDLHLDRLSDVTAAKRRRRRHYRMDMPDSQRLVCSLPKIDAMIVPGSSSSPLVPPCERGRERIPSAPIKMDCLNYEVSGEGSDAQDNISNQAVGLITSQPSCTEYPSSDTFHLKNV